MRTGRYLAICVGLSVWGAVAVGDIHDVGGAQSIQAAIDAADNGDEIEVAPGTYQGPGDETESSALIDFKGKTIRLYSREGPGVTTIDGSRYQHAVRCISGEGPGTVLEGFTITHGGWGSYPSGGGMYNENSSPTVTNCRFIANHAYYSGGAMYNYRSSPAVTRCTFVDNITYMGGGAVNNDVGNPVFADCLFSGNDSGYYGGAMYSSSANPVLTNCVFSSNRATYDGAGLYNHLGHPRIVNCTFANNVIGSPTDNGGGAMYNRDSSPTVVNCILWGNSGDQITGNRGTVTYSDVQGGWAGAGNINLDPRFASAGDYHLVAGSPCIDAGTNSPAGGLPATDLEGNPRPADGNGDGRPVADMGAYEAPATAPGQPLAGLIQQLRALDLEQGLSTALETKLNTAQRVFTDGTKRNDAAAVNALNAFVNSVKAQRGKKIAQADADALIAAAQQMIDSLISR